MQPFRSMLFSPGNRLDLVEKAARSGADAIIVDLEDAVPEASKAEARANLAMLPPADVPYFVRVNGGATPHLWADVVAAARAGVAGIILPKAEDEGLILRLDGALSLVEQETERAQGSILLLPMIESALGVLRVGEMCAAADRVQSVFFGSGEQGDLVVDMGVEWTPDGAGLLGARTQVILAARAVGIEHPMDAVFMDFRNGDALRRECELARRTGYLGKLAIHPSQVAIIHDVFTPAEDEVARARRILEAFDAALAEGAASISVDGRMVDYAVARLARSIVGRAEAATRTSAGETVG